TRRRLAAGMCGMARMPHARWKRHAAERRKLLYNSSLWTQQRGGAVARPLLTGGAQTTRHLMAPSYILGVSAFYHDSAACLLADGEIVAAAQEERFSRKKGDAAFPGQAVAHCLAAAGIKTSDLAYV